MGFRNVTTEVKAIDGQSEEENSQTVKAFLSASYYLSIYYTITVIVAACFCNPLAIVVFSRKAFKNSTVSIYLRFLSVIDLCAILVGLTRIFYKGVTNSVPRTNLAYCYFNKYLLNFFIYSSSWTLVVVTLERVMSIIWPHYVKVWCTLNTAKTIVFMMVIIISLTCLPYILIYGHIEKTDPETNLTVIVGLCTVVKNKEEAHFITWIFYGNFWAMVPSFILIVSNTIIICGVKRSRKKISKVNGTTSFQHNDVSSTTTKSTIDDLGSENSTSSVDKKPVSRQQPKSHNASKNSNPFTFSRAANGNNKIAKNSTVRRTKKEHSLTITLIAINMTFILCNFPLTAYSFTYMLPSPLVKEPLRSVISDFLALLTYSNNILNFVLYCATGTKFREELKLVLKNLCSLSCPCREGVK